MILIIITESQKVPGQSSWYHSILLLPDEPKKPGPVTLEQPVDGKVIITWAPSPDQELDDRLYYMVVEHDTNTLIWRTIANQLFCTTCTASVQSGHEYHFRIYAKNDMGLSEPSESPTWGVHSIKGKKILFRTCVCTWELIIKITIINWKLLIIIFTALFFYVLKKFIFLLLELSEIQAYTV